MKGCILAVCISAAATSLAADVDQQLAAEAARDFLATSPTSQTRFVKLLDTRTTDDSALVYFQGSFQGRSVVGAVNFIKMDSGKWRATGASIVGTNGRIQAQPNWVTYSLD